MTADLFGMVALPTLGMVLLVFGFAPPLVLRLILLLYPKGHEQRAELMAELRALPWKDRPIWVAEQLETGLTEGLGARFRARRERKLVERHSALLHLVTISNEGGDELSDVIVVVDSFGNELRTRQSGEAARWASAHNRAGLRVRYGRRRP